MPIPRRLWTRTKSSEGGWIIPSRRARMAILRAVSISGVRLLRCRNEAVDAATAQTSAGRRGRVCVEAGEAGPVQCAATGIDSRCGEIRPAQEVRRNPPHGLQTLTRLACR
jgi:hypothetical protein